MINRFILLLLGVVWPAETAPELFRGDKLWGYCSNGEVVIEEQFLEAKSFRGKLALVRTDKGWGVINSFGEMLITPTLEREPQYSNGVTYFHKGGLYGMLSNVEGHLVFPPLYDSIRRFGPRLFMLKKAGLWFAADGSGKFILSNGASHAYSLSESLVAYRTIQGWGILSHDGELVVQAFADKFEAPSFGIIRYKKNNLYGYLSDQGDILVSAEYSAATDFNESGIAFVNSSKGWLKIDRKGQVLNQLASGETERPVEIIARLFKQHESVKKIEVYQSNYVDYRYDPYGHYVYRRRYHRPVPYRSHRRTYYNDCGFGLGTRLFFKNGKIYGGGPSYGIGAWE